MYNYFYNFSNKKIGEGVFFRDNNYGNSPIIPILEPLEDNDSLALLDNNGNILLDNG